MPCFQSTRLSQSPVVGQLRSPRAWFGVRHAHYRYMASPRTTLHLQHSVKRKGKRLADRFPLQLAEERKHGCYEITRLKVRLLKRSEPLTVKANQQMKSRGTMARPEWARPANSAPGPKDNKHTDVNGSRMATHIMSLKLLTVCHPGQGRASVLAEIPCGVAAQRVHAGQDASTCPSGEHRAPEAEASKRMRDGIMNSKLQAVADWLG